MNSAPSFILSCFYKSLLRKSQLFRIIKILFILLNLKLHNKQQYLIDNKRSTNLLCIICFAVNLTFSKETWWLTVEGRKTNTAAQARSMPCAASNFQQISVSYWITTSCTRSEFCLKRESYLDTSIISCENLIFRLACTKVKRPFRKLNISALSFKNKYLFPQPFSFSPLSYTYSILSVFIIFDKTFWKVICYSYKQHEFLIRPLFATCVLRIHMNLLCSYPRKTIITHWWSSNHDHNNRASTNPQE